MSEMERFLEAFRKYLPPHWAVWVNGGRVEVRDRTDRRFPLLSFDAERNSPKELFHGLPEIVGSLIHQMHRDFCGLLDFTKETVADCAGSGGLPDSVVAKVQSTPVAWGLSEGVADQFPGAIVRKEKESKPCPTCLGTGRADRAPSVSIEGKPCPDCDGTGKREREDE